MLTDFRWNVVLWAAGAVLALGAAWFGQRYVAVRSELAVLRDQNELADIALKSVQQQLEAERIITRRRLQDARQPLAGVHPPMSNGSVGIANPSSAVKTESALAHLKITMLASRMKEYSLARAVCVWDPARQEGVLNAEHLPTLAANEDYRLWLVDPQYPNPVDGGGFTVDPESGQARLTFESRQPIGAGNAFAVTRERKGGGATPGGPFILFGR
jgi:hypothetical protein